MPDFAAYTFAARFAFVTLRTLRLFTALPQLVRLPRVCLPFWITRMPLRPFTRFAHAFTVRTPLPFSGFRLDLLPVYCARLCWICCVPCLRYLCVTRCRTLPYMGGTATALLHYAACRLRSVVTAVAVLPRIALLRCVCHLRYVAAALRYAVRYVVPAIVMERPSLPGTSFTLPHLRLYRYVGGPFWCCIAVALPILPFALLRTVVPFISRLYAFTWSLPLSVALRCCRLPALRCCRIVTLPAALRILYRVAGLRCCCPGLRSVTGLRYGYYRIAFTVVRLYVIHYYI